MANFDCLTVPEDVWGQVRSWIFLVTKLSFTDFPQVRWSIPATRRLAHLQELSAHHNGAQMREVSTLRLSTLWFFILLRLHRAV